jgi:hypothetical protein
MISEENRIRIEEDALTESNLKKGFNRKEEKHYSPQSVLAYDLVIKHRKSERELCDREHAEELRKKDEEIENFKALINNIWIMTSDCSNGELLREGYREIFEQIDSVLKNKEQTA